MTDPKQDLENIKSKLLEHIKSTYDETKSNEMITKIQAMNDEQFITFLQSQGLIGGNNTNQGNPNCVFCSMVAGQIPTTQIANNTAAIAILEINPISLGHAMIIPKQHITKSSDLPKEVDNVANEVIEDLTRAFKPKRVDKINANIMGHEILNLIPVYNNETIESQRLSETPEGLAKVKQQIDDAKPKQIEVSPQPQQITQEVPSNPNEINETNTWLPRRTP